MGTTENSYVNHVKNLVRDPDRTDYESLLERLWQKEYYSILPNDQNREKDGLLLRNEILNDEYYNIFGPCRVLEMLIALSKRMEWEISGTGYDATFKDLFWEMIDNLGLLKFDNLAIMKDIRTLELDKILTDWIERQYSPDGSGGIFPINDWKRGVDKPQTKVEVWYQMMLYLSKNYEFN